MSWLLFECSTWCEVVALLIDLLANPKVIEYRTRYGGPLLSRSSFRVNSVDIGRTLFSMRPGGQNGWRDKPIQDSNLILCWKLKILFLSVALLACLVIGVHLAGTALLANTTNIFQLLEMCDR